MRKNITDYPGLDDFKDSNIQKSYSTQSIEKASKGSKNKEVNIKDISTAAEDIKYNGDYGHLFYHPERKEVFWNGADGDDENEGYSSCDEIKKLLKIEGVNKVHIESEANPNLEDGWEKVEFDRNKNKKFLKDKKENSNIKKSSITETEAFNILNIDTVKGEKVIVKKNKVENKDEIQKSEIFYAFNSSLSGLKESNSSGALLFKKTGSELKSLVIAKRDSLQSQCSEIQEKILTVKTKLEEAGVEFTKNFNKMEATEKPVYSYNDTDTTKMSLINEWSDYNYTCRSNKEDMKILNVLINNLSDKEKYTLNAQQLSLLEV